jgi:sodium transport system permease protein
MLRDRRTIVMSVVLPLLVMPILLFASHAMNTRRERRLANAVFDYVLTGPRALEIRSVLEGAAPPAVATDEPSIAQFREVHTADAEKALADGAIHFYLEATRVADATGALGAGRNRGTRGESRDMDEPLWPLPPGSTVVTIVFRGDRDDSETGANRMRRLLIDTRRKLHHAALRDHGFPVPPGGVARVETANLASEGQIAGLTLGRLLTPLLLLFLLSGGAVVAIDSLAGEKERGTLETLLTTAVGRAEIVAAKQLLILTVAVAITVIQVGNLLAYVGFRLIPTTMNLSAAVSPLTAAVLLVLYLPVAALVSSVLLLISGHARSYKEAQLYFFPVFLVGMLPSLAAVLPGLALRSAIVVVPVANISVAVKEILIGQPDWPFVAIAWATTAAAALVTSRATTRALSTERLISPAAVEATGLASGATLFPRHVVRWFALLWAANLILSLNFSTRVDIRIQTLVTLLGIFLGGSLLMIRRYRLDAREALALRPVRPAVWVGVLTGVPAGILTGVGVFRLANLVLPVPDRLIESFGELLLPETVPIWQLLLLFTILPGVCEEIAFRGILLYGLRRRLRPAALVLVVGLVFGLFHVSLFRIAPTAYLGMLLATVVLLTGSIFPAMAWHALHNGLSLVAGEWGWSFTRAEPGTYVAAAAVLAASFWLIWRNRTPYPDLRRRRPTGRHT